MRPEEYRRAGSRLARSLSEWPQREESAEGPEHEPAAPARGAACGRVLALALGATGVVFGDIGTSPLYVFSTIFDELHSVPHPDDVVGALSVIFWSLTWVVCFKYVLWVMRVSHHGEGGTFALMQVILSGGGDTPLGAHSKALMIFLGVLGCSLIIGDGAITPVMSVLSALEGLPGGVTMDWQVVIAVVILFLLFLAQSGGSRLIGLVSGPLMVVWFLAIGGIGVYNLALQPEAAKKVVCALSPVRFYDFWVLGNYSGIQAWHALAGVVLCVTGAEALYADMGHFGRGPISLAWFALVYPCLVLQYMGQAALLVADPLAHPFWGGVPPALRWLMTVLAPLAAIVASQALISGVFSLLTQAHALDFLPRILVCHTNPEEPGQVYIPEVNWALCTACIVLCVAFKTSTKLAGAYGIAVTCTFVVTTGLLWMVLRRVWGWRLPAALALTVPLLVVDLAFWSANVLKIADSGWVPVAISAVACLLMYVHHWGRRQEDEAFEAERQQELAAAQRVPPEAGAPVPLATLCTLEALRAELRSTRLQRTDTVGVFLTPKPWRVPRSLGVLAKQLGCLPGTIVLLSFRFEAVPFVAEEDRVTFDAPDAECGLFRVGICLGYAEPLSAKRLAVRATLGRIAKERAGAYPALAALAPPPAAVEEDEESVATSAESGAGEEEAAAAGAATFFFNRLHFATAPEQGLWTRLRIGLYGWLVLNARRPICFFGLQDSNTLEISSVRFICRPKAKA